MLAKFFFLIIIIDFTLIFFYRLFLKNFKFLIPISYRVWRVSKVNSNWLNFFL